MKNSIIKKNEELLKETGTSALKGAIGAVPFVGTALNEMIFETRNRLKQNRINHFIENFSNYLSDFSETDVDFKQVQSDEFGDLFEEIILKVSKTHSTAKLEAFKCLLGNQITKPRNIDYAELMIDIVSSLQEKQITILKGYSENFSSLYNDLRGDLINLEKQYYSLDEDISDKLGRYSRYGNKYHEEICPLEHKRDGLKEIIEKTKIRIEEEKKPFVALTYNCENYEFYFLVHDLCNKGLLLDIGAKYSAEALELVEITQLGFDLIEFIEEQKASS
jgi:hypothetical protein